MIINWNKMEKKQLQIPRQTLEYHASQLSKAEGRTVTPEELMERIQKATEVVMSDTPPADENSKMLWMISRLFGDVKKK